MKLNTVIIEDEIPAARLLHSMVSSLRPEWNIEIIPGSVDDAVEWFASHEHPELIFWTYILQTEMPSTFCLQPSRNQPLSSQQHMINMPYALFP